jgi:hypothetical protein
MRLDTVGRSRIQPLIVRLFVCLLGAAISSCVAPKTKPNAALFIFEREVLPTDVLTQHGDPARTGANIVEALLTPDKVRSGDFGRLFDWQVDGQIYGQPLYASHVTVKGRTIDLVIVTTMNNSVYAFEAPAPESDVQPPHGLVWQVTSRDLGKPLVFDYFPMSFGFLGHNIEPLIGIASTPVIDRHRGLLFVTVKSGTGGFLGFWARVHYRLFAIDLVSGKVLHSVDIAGAHKGANGVDASFDPKYQLQRAGLLEEQDRIYLAFGSHQDTAPYHGWVVAYDADNLANSWVYCTTCGRVATKDPDDGSLEGGIWQAGGGPVGDGAGNIYVMTGNGSYNRDTSDLATSFIRLDKNLEVIGSWTPPNVKCLNDSDSDLGSAGPLLIANQRVLVGGGKEGLLYAIRADALQGPQMGSGRPLGLRDVPDDPCAYADPSPGPVGNTQAYWTIQAAPLWKGDAIMDVERLITPAGLTQGYHHIHGAPVLWQVHDALGDRTLLYVSAERDLLRAYEFSGGFVTASPHGVPPIDTFESYCPNTERGMPGGFLTLSANGNDPNSGIIWAAMPRRHKDALNHVVFGVLRAYRAYPDASGKLVELWNSDNGADPDPSGLCEDQPPSGSDELGYFAKFVPPTVSGGKVYIATFSNRLAVYGYKRVADTGVSPELAGYAAQLTADPLPQVVTPGSTVAISITATNTGSLPWLSSDQIRLSSRSIPDFEAAVVENKTALMLRADVAPGQSVTFKFHVRIPRAEATYYYKWRLIRAGEASKQPSGDWFGDPSPEWSFSALRAACIDLRGRSAAITANIPKEQVMPQTIAAQVHAIGDEAAKAGCMVSTDSMKMSGPAPGPPR